MLELAAYNPTKVLCRINLPSNYARVQKIWKTSCLVGVLVSVFSFRLLKWYCFV